MMPKVPAIVYDPDAQLFFNAETTAGVTLSTTEMNAVNQWVVDSKAANIWTKMKAVYPMVGGSPTSQKFNLKNPLDTNAAFRLNFIGGGTHSSNGYQPNGINAYANTFLNPSVAYSIGTSGHMSYYSRTDSNGASEREMGALTGVIYTDLGLRYSGNLYMRWGETGGPTQVASPNSLGFYVASRTAINVQKIFKNGTQVLTSALTGNLLPNLNFYLGCQNSSNSPTNYTAKQCAFASIGDGLTDLESQLFYQITEKYQVALSRNINALQSFYYNPAYNNETNAFLFSTQITDNTIQTATNTLVTDLKTAGVYTKMRAIYPMVGGTATTHQYNFINPQNTNAANRLSFNGLWTHSSNGALPSGTGGSHADTYISGLPQNSTHLLYYSRTNASTDSVDMGVTGTNNIGNRLAIRRSGQGSALINSLAFDPSGITVADSRGCFMANRTASNVLKFIKNGVVLTTYATASTGVPATFTLLLAATTNNSGSTLFSSNKECAFASAGDGLTDLESQLLYQIVEKYQVALSRNVNALQSFYYNPSYNNETNAFLFSTQITDTTTQLATNTLVSDLKTANIFTKMKAIYPMVGGTATTCKFNLANAQDTNEAFRLVFSGGGTFSANGYLPNGTNAYASTFLNPLAALTNNNTHMSYYSRTVTSGANRGLIGASTGATSLPLFTIYGRNATNSVTMDSYDYTTCRNFISEVTGAAFYINSRTTSTSFKSYRNAVMALNNAASNTYNVATINFPITIGALNLNGAVGQFGTFQCAFASIGDGLTDAEALAFYNAVQTFNTSLFRNV
jgi:hypothetical protein